MFRVAISIGAAAEGALRAQPGYRCHAREIRDGALVFFGHPIHLEREQRLEAPQASAPAANPLPSLTHLPRLR